MNQPARAKAVGSRSVRGTFRWSVGFSAILHAVAMLGLWLVRPAVLPVTETRSVELIMVPAERATPPPESANPSVPEATPAPDVEPETPPPPTMVQEPPAVATIPEPPANPEPRPMPSKPRPPSQVRAQPHPGVRPHAANARAPTTPGPAAPPVEARSAPTSPAISAQPAAPARADPAWLAGVSQWLLEHRSYPEMARRLGRQGTVVLQITVDPDGRVLDVALVQGSGTESLDQAAETLVRNAHLPPFPPDMTLPRQTVTLPIRYRLE